MNKGSAVGEVITLAAVGVVLAIALYYYFGTSTIIGSIGTAGGNFVSSYGSLLKPTYPIATKVA